MTITPNLLVDFSGIIVGIISVLMIVKLKGALGGRMGGALNMVLLGIVANILALTYTVVFMKLKLFSNPLPFDAHHLLMTISMILFVFSAKKFSSLVRP
ncbi:MAG: hypothetical protein HYS15_00835 [Candidatus Spechtbacteria bacterium]|nr:hypothetical protein [Candidatus Spechtbacteria bacterium]